MAVKDIFRLLRQRFFRHKVSQTNPMSLTDKSMLVVAPHPDDETFGCAGLIAQKLKLGAEVSVVFLTNGENSLANVPQEEIKLYRQKSAKDAAKILGVSTIYFLGLKDGAIPRKNDESFVDAVKKITQIIEEVTPLELYCTHAHESWSDHNAAAELTIVALQKLDKPISLYMYWVWVWFSVPLKRMNVLNFSQTYHLSIGDVMKTKKEAIDCYLNALHVSKEPYCGRLPKMFLKAFEWPYEVFEKVEYR